MCYHFKSRLCGWSTISFVGAASRTGGSFLRTLTNTPPVIGGADRGRIGVWSSPRLTSRAGTFFDGGRVGLAGTTRHSLGTSHARQDTENDDAQR